MNKDGIKGQRERISSVAGLGRGEGRQGEGLCVALAEMEGRGQERTRRGEDVLAAAPGSALPGE